MGASLLALGPDMSTSFLAQNLRYLMQQRDLTASGIAQRGGPSQPTVSRIVKDGHVYIFCWGDEWFIKRIFKTQSGLMLRSDNPDRHRYPDKYVEREAMNQVKILGRIVTVMSDM